MRSTHLERQLVGEDAADEVGEIAWNQLVVLPLGVTHQRAR